MLYLDAPLELQRVTIFRDHAAPGRFYYLPKHPQLAMDGGQPAFQLLIYRRDITDNPAFREGDRRGGGFLVMTVDLHVSKETQDTIKEELHRRTGLDVDLAPVPLEGGSVRVTALGSSSGAETEGAAPHFVEKILCAGKPSLYGDNRAVFSMELDAEGALLMRAALEDEGATQVAVVYDLEYMGLMPAYEVEVHIQMEVAYSYLRDRMRLNTLFFKSDIDREVEELQKRQMIQIKEVSYLPTTQEAQAGQRDRLNNLIKEIAQGAFFKPALNPGTVLAADRGGDVAPADPTQAAQAVTAGFSTPLHALLTGRGSPNPGSALPPARSDATGGIGGTPTQAPATTAQPTQPQPTTPDGQAGSGISPALAAWNAAGRPQASYQRRELSQHELQRTDYNLAQVSAQKRSIAPQGAIRMLSGAANLTGRIKEVDLNNPFFETIAGTVSCAANLAEVGVTAMSVELWYGVREDGTRPYEKATFPINTTGKAGDYRFNLDRRFTQQLEYQISVSYKPGFAIGDPALEAKSGWISTTTRNLEIDPGLVGKLFRVRLRVGEVDRGQVQQVIAEVRYKDAPSQIDSHRTIELTAEVSEADVYIRPTQKDDFEVVVTWRYHDGEEVEHLAGKGESLFVLNQPDGRFVPIKLELRDPLSRYERAIVTVTQGEGPTAQQHEVEILGASDHKVLGLRRASADQPVSISWTAVLMHKDGATTRQSSVGSTLERLVLVGDITAGKRKIGVRFRGGVSGDIGLSGYDGAELLLRFPGAAPGTDDQQQWYLEGRPGLTEWEAYSAEPTDRTFHYRVSFFPSDGDPVVIEGDTTDDLLLLAIPRRTASP